jgi:hypothetical protein
MTWFYTSNGNQFGPVTQQELAAKVQRGEVRGSDLIWKEGMVDWLPLNQVPEFSGVIPSPPQFGAPMSQPNYYNPAIRPNITNYLWQSIVVTLLCCMPFGIVAIVYATKVDGLVASGDYFAAEAASKSAKFWVWLTFGIGLLLNLLSLIFFFFVMAAGSM